MTEDILTAHPEIAAGWTAAIAAAEQLVDKLGRPMDPGIVPTVAALHLLGLPTSGSCHGHWHRASSGPWVHVGPPESGGGVSPLLRAQVDELLDGFNAGRCELPRHLRLQTFDVFGERLDQPTCVRIEALGSHEVMLGRRHRSRPELHAARREMTAFTGYLLRKLVVE